MKWKHNVFILFVKKIFSCTLGFYGWLHYTIFFSNCFAYSWEFWLRRTFHIKWYSQHFQTNTNMRFESSFFSIKYTKQILTKLFKWKRFWFVNVHLLKIQGKDCNIVDVLPFEKINGKSQISIHTKMGKSCSERIVTLLFIIKVPDDLKPL